MSASAQRADQYEPGQSPYLQVSMRRCADLQLAFLVP